MFGQPHSDAAKRVADEFNLHRVASGQAAIGRWVAFTLADGTSDHQIYDTRWDAVTHQHHHEQQCMFLQITPTTLSVCDAEALLSMHRRMYDAGVRLVDPDHRAGGREVIRRVTREDMKAQIRTIATGGRTRPSNLIFPKG